MPIEKLLCINITSLPTQTKPQAFLDESSGLLAVGGNLRIETLLSAYRQGIFPWYEHPEPIMWFSPDPRALLFPQQLHISRSLKKFFNKSPFRYSFNHCFSEVMRQCAAPRKTQARTWIQSPILAAYTALHQHGHAHSVEVWQDEKLVGGLYGVSIGCAFFGESMFSLSDNASKCALIFLCQQLENAGFHFIDCQVSSAHLHSLGAINVPREEFLLRLANAIKQEPLYLPWQKINPNC